MTLDRAAVDAALDGLMEQHDAAEASWRADMDVQRATVERLEQRVTELTAPPPETYTVQPGDTLLKIGDRFRVQALRIMGWNRLAADSVIRPGQVLYLTGPAPGGQPVPQPEPVPRGLPLVRSVNWWCADGWRDGQRVLHHLDEFGQTSPEVAAYAALAQRTTGTEYSFDTSTLGDDADRAEGTKIDAHKQLLGVTRVRNIRVFFGDAPPTWTGSQVEHRRIAALKPGDSFLFSSLSTDWAAWERFLANTPDHLRGAVLGCFGHEREANLDRGPKLKAWLAGNAQCFDLFDAAEKYGYVTDEHFGKITLFYSQEIDKKSGVSIPNREDMYGGQDRGWFGEDVYNPRASKSYRSAERLFGPITSFCRDIGRPCRIPEWGGERVPSDKTGAGRAKWIAACAAYIEATSAA